MTFLLLFPCLDLGRVILNFLKGRSRLYDAGRSALFSAIPVPTVQRRPKKSTSDASAYAPFRNQCAKNANPRENANPVFPQCLPCRRAHDDQMIVSIILLFGALITVPFQHTNCGPPCANNKFFPRGRNIFRFSPGLKLLRDCQSEICCC